MVFGGERFRFSLFEFGVIIGLNYDEFPEIEPKVDTWSDSY